MIRGTTPTLLFHVQKEVQVLQMKQIWVTLKGNTNEMTFDIEDLVLDGEENTIKINMTQEETLSFYGGPIRMQIRVLTKDGKALASKIMSTDLSGILKDGVISGGANG